MLAMKVDSEHHNSEMKITPLKLLWRLSKTAVTWVESKSVLMSPLLSSMTLRLTPTISARRLARTTVS